MSYLQSHILFVLPPMLLPALGPRQSFSAFGLLVWLGLLLKAVLALVYATPWDTHGACGSMARSE